MTLFDYILITVMVCSIIISMVRGLIDEVLALLSWVAAFFMANAFGEQVAQWMPEIIPGKLSRMILAFILLFIGVRLIAALVTKAVSALVQASGLALVDKTLGSVFGFLRGVLMVIVMALICGMTEIPKQHFWKEALFSPYVELAVKWVLPYVPGTLAKHVKFGDEPREKISEEDMKAIGDMLPEDLKKEMADQAEKEAKKIAEKMLNDKIEESKEENSKAKHSASKNTH